MKIIKNARIMPLEGTMDSFTGGIYSSEGKFIKDSIGWRGKQPPLQDYTESLQGTYIYGGCLFGHFGHFIWESLSRLHTIRKCNNYPVLFISPNDKIYSIQKTWLRTINVLNEVHIIKKPTLIEKLIYSSPGSSIWPLAITDEQADALKCKTFHDCVSKKIWLSRSKLKYGKLDNECDIEEKIRELGFDIVYPEDLHLQEQIRLVSTSSIVAGCDGSAFFSLLFSQNVYGKFFVFNRRRDIPATLPYMFQKRNIQFEKYIFDLEPVEEKWPISIFHQPNIYQIIDVLKSIKV